MKKTIKQLGNSFKKVGKSYHLGRRDYPKELMKDITKISGINKESSVLDVGCGTGKSTIPFTKTGAKLIGIDISGNMLKIARELSANYKNIEYEQISFEKFSQPKSSFNLILFGTSIHWLDSKMVYKRANFLLKKNGHVALFWEPIGNLCKEIRLLGMEEIFTINCPNYPKSPYSMNIPKKRINEIIKSRLFAKPILKKYKITQKYNLEEFLYLINSYSWVISLNKNKKDKLMQEVKTFLSKKKITLKFRTEMYLIMAKRK